MSETAQYPQFRWYVLFTLCILTVATSVIMIFPAPLIGVIAKNLGTELGVTTGALMGGFNLALGLACIIGGFLCDRFGLVKVALFGCALMIIPTLLMPSYGNNLTAIVILRLIQACGAGPILAMVSCVAAIWFPPLQRGIVTGIQGMSVTLGIAVGFVSTPALNQAIGNWQVATAWLSAICFAGMVLTLVIPFGPKPPALAPAENKGTGDADKGDFRLAMRQPVSWIGVLVVFSLCWVLSAFNDLTPAYFAIDPPIGVGYGPMMAGKLMTVVQVAFMLGAVATGFVMEKIFKGATRPVILIGFAIFAIFAVSIMLPAVYGAMSILVPCLFIAGFFEAWVVPNVFAFISLHYPAHIAGKLSGMWFGIGLFGGTIGVILGATALHQTGNYHVSILIVGAVAIIGFILATFMKPPKVFSLTDGKVVKTRD